MTYQITNELTTSFRQKFASSGKKVALQRGMVKNGIYAMAENPDGVRANTPVFSVDLTVGPVANQKQSGRCWMFAALNTFRHRLLHQYQLKDFELSQTYTFFWDKYEKANYFYENILQTAGEELTSRKVAFLLSKPQEDGGQWDMIASIFKKCGVVPKSAMPETPASSGSKELNSLLNKKLRKDAIRLRQLVSEGAEASIIQGEREGMLEDVYNILTLSLGTPPAVFDFEYRNDNGEYHLEQNLTPQNFFDQYIGIDIDNYVSVINAPTADKPYNQVYTVEMLGNVVGGNEVRHLNLPMDAFKQLAAAQLSSGESVWFGCDVGQSSERDNGIMALDLYDFEDTFDANFGMTKAERLDYGESLMTHAMVLTGVDIVDDAPVRWKVENSWGDKVGVKGFFVMSDAWMDEYTYQIVVRKDLLTPEQLAAYEGSVTPLAPWDPMGSLA